MLSINQRQAIWIRECGGDAAAIVSGIFGPSFLDWVLELPIGEPPASALLFGDAGPERIRAEVMPSPWGEVRTAA